MSEEQPYLSRRNKNNRRKTKGDDANSRWNGILNVLIAIVGLLLIISLILILTNTNVKEVFNKDKEAIEDVAPNEENFNPNATTDGVVDEEVEDESEEEQQTDASNSEGQSNQNEKEQQTSTESNEENESDTTDEDIESQLQYITTVDLDDPLVMVAWTDSRWTPLATEQTGTHLNMFDADHIDYQEKLALLYRDTGFTENNSIVWNVKNASGNAIAVISSRDKQHIFRLTMKWVPNKGWQTILIEQLKSLEGAY